MRKQLLEENKTGRYIKYAIGEIFLVMIGILLALQVNNWNNNRELKMEELKVLKSLHKEFSENSLRFDVIYRKQQYRKKSIETLMSINYNELSLDSLRNIVRGASAQWTFDPFQGIYNSVINSGKIELISNDSLKRKIASFQDLLIDYKEEEIGTRDITTNNLYPYVMDNLDPDFNARFGFKERTAEEKSKYRIKFIQFIESDKFESIMTYVYGFMRSIFIEGPALQEEMTSIISLLESEIETQN